MRGRRGSELVRQWLARFGPERLPTSSGGPAGTLATPGVHWPPIDTVAVDLDGVRGLVLAADIEPVPEPAPWIALLPALDPTPMGWSGRDWYIEPEHRAALFDRTGNIGPSVWCDGRIVGGWGQRADGVVVWRLFTDIGAASDRDGRGRGGAADRMDRRGQGDPEVPDATGAELAPPDRHDGHADHAAGSRVETLLAELVSRAGRDNPYPVYEALRRDAPVARMPDGSLLLTRFDDCAAALRDPNIGHGEPDWPATSPACRTGENICRCVSFGPACSAWTRRDTPGSGGWSAARSPPGGWPGLRPFIESTTVGTAGRVPGRRRDGLHLGVRLSVADRGDRRIARGARPAIRPSSSTLAREWTQVLDVTTPRILARADIAAGGDPRTISADLAPQRRRPPQADLLSALLVGEGDERLTEDELLTMAALLFAAGFETATHLLGNGLVALLRHPDQLELLAASPRARPEPRWRNCCGSTAPCRSPAATSCGTRDRRRSGRRPGNGWWSAWARPITTRPGSPTRPAGPGRADGGSMSFGGGIHYCLGAPLARLEAQVALPAVIRRFPRLAVREPLHRRVSLTVRGFLRIPVSTSENPRDDKRERANGGPVPAIHEARSRRVTPGSRRQPVPAIPMTRSAG